MSGGEREGPSPKRRRKGVRRLHFVAAQPEMPALSSEAWRMAGAAGLGPFLGTTHLPKVHETFCTDFISSYDAASRSGFVRSKSVVLSVDAVHRATLLPLGILAPEFEVSSPAGHLQIQLQLQQMPSATIDCILKIAKAASSLMNLSTAEGTFDLEGVPGEVIRGVLASIDKGASMQWAGYFTDRIAASVEQIRSGADRHFSLGRWLTAVIHVCLGESVAREREERALAATADHHPAAADFVPAPAADLAPAPAADLTPAPAATAALAISAPSGREEEHRFILPDDYAAMLEDDPSFMALLQARQEALKEEASSQKSTGGANIIGQGNEGAFTLRSCGQPRAVQQHEDADDELIAHLTSAVLEKRNLKLKLDSLSRDMVEKEAEKKTSWLLQLNEEKDNIHKSYDVELLALKREIDLLKNDNDLVKKEKATFKIQVASLRRDAVSANAEVERLSKELQVSIQAAARCANTRRELESKLKPIQEEIMADLVKPVTIVSSASLMNQTQAAFNKMKEQEKMVREMAEQEKHALQEKVLELEKELAAVITEKESLEQQEKESLQQLEKESELEVLCARDLSLVRRRRWLDDVDEMNRPENWPIICGDFTSEQACILSYSNFSNLHKDSKDKLVADAAYYCRKLAEWLSLEDPVPLIINVNRPMDDWEDVGLYRRLVFLESSNLWEFEKMCKRKFLMGASLTFSTPQLSEDRRVLAEGYERHNKEAALRIRYRHDQDWKSAYPALKKTGHKAIIDDDFITRLKSRQAHSGFASPV